MLRPVGIRIQHTHAANQRRHFRCRQGHQMRLVEKQLLGRHNKVRLQIVAETVSHRLQHGKALYVGLVLHRVTAASSERNAHIMAGTPGCLFDRGSAAQNDQISHGHLLATRLGCIECRLHTLKRVQHLAQLGWLIDLPFALRGQAQAGTIGTATLVRTAIGRSRRPGRTDKLGYGQAGGHDCAFQRCNISIVNHRMIRRRDRVLPDQVFSWHLGTHIAGLWSHIAVCQLEPGACKRIGKLVHILMEPARDLQI